MSLGTSNITINQKRSGAGGIAAGDARNGVSVSASKVVLGNAIGEAGDPGALLSHREILTNNFSIGLEANAGAVNPVLFGTYDVVGHIKGITLSNENAGATAKIAFACANDNNQQIILGIESAAAASANRRYVDSGGGMLDLGDCFGAGGGTKIRINESGSQITVTGQVQINGVVPGTQTLLIKCAASQSNTALEIQNSSGTSLMFVLPSGRMTVTDYVQIKGTDIFWGDLAGTGYAFLTAGGNFGIKFGNNAGTQPFIFEFTGNNDALAFCDLNIIRTRAISGAVGTRGKWKLGSKLTGYVATADAAEVEIDGVVYYLLMGVPI